MSQALEQSAGDPRVKNLLSAVGRQGPGLILTHNNPDPDALASAWALKFLLEQAGGIAARIVYGGILGREENRALNRLLRIGAVKARATTFKKTVAVLMVDCQPGAGNNPLPEGIEPVAVIDHHPRIKGTKAAFVDIRPECGATTTILVEYLREAEIDIPSDLATALYYGLVSETQHLGRDVTRGDIEASIYLFPKVKHRLISRIEHPVHSREFFQQLHGALEKAVTYKKFVGAKLGEIDYPDFVSQFADLLVSLKRATWCFVTGRLGDTLYCSLRTTHPKAQAGKILRQVVGKRGSAGGHEMIAGGQIPLQGLSPEEITALEEAVYKCLYRKLRLPEDFTPAPLVIPRAVHARI